MVSTFSGEPQGSAVCGSLTNVTNTSVTYAAPATVPPGALGVTATSVTDNSKSFTATVAITATGAGGQIAFLTDRDGNYEIYTMKADGSGQVNLTNNPSFDDGATWSPDGSKIVFYTDRDGNSEIYVMNADGSGLVNLTNDPGSDQVPAWSPDGTKIAFNRGDQIYVMNAGGSGVTALTAGPDFFGPAWSHDGAKIAGTRWFPPPRRCKFCFGHTQIFVANADGSGLVDLTSGETPAWSPDGRIAFANGDIYVMNADGSGLTDLTNAPAFDGWPAWSPDGTKIAFVSNRGSAYDLFGTALYDLYVMNADGTGVVQLTHHYVGQPEGRPAWSPDGKRIAFASVASDRFDDDYEIYVINADGSGEVALTDNSTFDGDPAWRP